MKILIWAEAKNGGPYDIFRTLDYGKVYEELVENYHANSINVGNKVWIQGLISALSTPENELFFLDAKESWDEINSKYDKIVYSAANMLCKNYLGLIENVASIFRNAKIPVYVIAIGAQARSYDDIGQLVKETAKATSLFMDSIYSTGGEIACRGFFTKEYLDKVASNSAVVTGCPSLFQNGRELKIRKQEAEVSPIFNGNAPFSALSRSYEESIYIDQGDYLNITYDLNSYSPRRYLANSIAKFGRNNVALYLAGRIKIFYDLSEWRNYIRGRGYNISIGSRIHGNIMSLLSGIPAVVFPIDSRTREMAEFYHIPTMNSKAEYSDIRRLFGRTDYTEFNAHFPRLFDSFNAFLKRCGLVSEINANNQFWDKKPPHNGHLIRSKRLALEQRWRKQSFIDRMYFKFSQKFPRMAEINEIKQMPITEEYAVQKP